MSYWQDETSDIEKSKYAKKSNFDPVLLAFATEPLTYCPKYFEQRFKLINGTVMLVTFLEFVYQ